jgi:ATP-dependent Clp protease adaptor protein ClpS
MSTAIEEEVVIKEDTDEKTRHQPRYAVVVHNDEDHTFEYVIATFVKVFRYTPERCLELATEIHTKGKAMVWTGSLEVAELKKEHIVGMGFDFWGRSKKVDWPLGVTLEPVD